MTINLTASILISGASQPSGTSLTLNAAAEAELVNRGVAVYTSRALTPGEGLVPAMLLKDASGGVSLVGADGVKYAAIPLDANGNAVAEVTPRSGTLAALLAVTDAGIGEIASATDADAIVKYLGSGPSVGKAYYMSKEVGRVITAFTLTSVAAATATTMPLDSAVIDTLGVVDIVNEWFTVPSGVTEMSCSVKLTGLTGAGTYRKMFIEYDVTGGAAWIPFSTSEAVRANVASLLETLQETFEIGSLASFVGKRVRVRFIHDHTAALASVAGSIQIKFRNY